MKNLRPWKTFLIPSYTGHSKDGYKVDPNKWTITRSHGICAIVDEDGKLIDEPNDTGQSDSAVIRHGIVWLLMDFENEDMDEGAHDRIFEICLNDTIPHTPDTGVQK